MLTHFGKALRQIRINRGILLKDMAETLGYKCPYLSKIETGEELIPTDLVARLSAVYDLSDEEKASLIEPCPFCGGEGKTATEAFSNALAHYVKCEQCRALTGYYKSESAAIVAWNRRVSNESR